MTTGEPTSMPRELPWSMVTVENQAVGDWAMTRALTGAAAARPSRRSSASSFSYWAFWRRASLPARAWRLRAALDASRSSRRP
ncbi:MAG: hypothetical protein ACKOK7_01505 [Solirubrobacterales bacterium]